MARFFADHDVSAQTAVLLRRFGHDVVVARDVHQERAPDYRQVLTAAEHNRIFVTHNEKHFVLLHGAWRRWSAAWHVSPEHSGVPIIPRWVSTLPQWSPEGAARELTDFVGGHPSAKNELFMWRRSTGWQLLTP